MLDFSNKPELAYLADLAHAFKGVAGDLPYYLAGATARDLLLEQAHGINPGRDTRDLDLAVMVANWATFEQVRSALIEGGRFAPVGNVLHKLRFQGAYAVDLIPFGAIERDDRTIAWPPDGDVVMGVFGFQEVYEATIRVMLPRKETIRMVSLAALTVLKLFAWNERRLSRPGADAHDIAVILRHYLDAGNLERLYTEAEHLLEQPDFDYEEAGAWLLGHDMAGILPTTANSRLGELLDRESNTEGAANLIGDLPIEADRAIGLLSSLRTGFMEGSKE